MTKITLIVHDIRSTHNVGSILRTAEGFGVEKIIFSGYTPYPIFKGDTRLPHIANKLHSQIHKTALGAESLVPFQYYELLEDYISENNASSSTLPIYALEQAPNSTLIQNFLPAKSFALLLGEEVNGISSTYLSQCKEVIEIPMVGLKESFNVSVACGIALYALSLNGDTLITNNLDQPTK